MDFVRANTKNLLAFSRDLICANMQLSRMISGAVFFGMLTCLTADDFTEVPISGAALSLNALITKAKLGNFASEKSFLIDASDGVAGVGAFANSDMSGGYIALTKESGQLKIAWRPNSSTSAQTIALNSVSGDDFLIERREKMIYLYTTDGLHLEPIVAVELDLGLDGVAGALLEDTSSGGLPVVSTLPLTLAKTFDLKMGQTGTMFEGDWSLQQNSNSINGNHLVHASDEDDANISVTLNGLYAGGYDLWMRYVSATDRSENVQITVNTEGESLELETSQKVPCDLWLGLGRCQRTQTGTAVITVGVEDDDEGTVSMDAVHLLWSSWTDSDQDQLPDAWELANLTAGATSRPASQNDLSKWAGAVAASSATSQGQGKRSMEGDRQKVRLYVNAGTGDDANDGSEGTIQPGPWHAGRVGPKRTLVDALKHVGSAKIVELYLDGLVETPIAGFGLDPDVSLMIQTGQQGATLETVHDVTQEED